MSDFLNFSAIVWGSSVKHQPQKVGKDHQLNDEDVIQIVKKWGPVLYFQSNGNRYTDADLKGQDV